VSHVQYGTTSTGTTSTKKTAATTKPERFSWLFGSPSKQEVEANDRRAPNSVTAPISDIEEDPSGPKTATEAVEMISNLFKMSLQAGEEPPTEQSSKDISKNFDLSLTSEDSVLGDKKKKNGKGHRGNAISKKTLNPSVISEDSVKGDNKKKNGKGHRGNAFSKKTLDPSVISEDSVMGDKKKKNGKGHSRSMSHMSFFRSSKKEKKKEKKEKREKKAEQPPKPTKKEEELPPAVEEKPADIYDLTNWLWSPFIFATDETEVGPKDEPIVVVMEDDVKSDKNKSDKNKKDKKGLRTWSQRDKREMKKKDKKKHSSGAVTTGRARVSKDSKKRRKAAEDQVIIQDDHDNFVPSTRAWSQPIPPPLPKEKRGSKSGTRKSLKSRFLGKKMNTNSDDINIVSFTNPKGKGQEMMLMTDSVSKTLHKRNKSHSALVKSLYEGGGN